MKFLNQIYRLLTFLEEIPKYRIKKNGIVYVLILHSIPQEKYEFFERILNYIKDKYDFINPVDFKNFLKGNFIFKGKRVLLTFDDGFDSNFHVANRILDKLNILAFFFISPSFTNSKSIKEQTYFLKKNLLISDQNHEIKSMNWEHIIRLSELGHEIGSHTMNHYNLTNLSMKKLEYELKESKNIIQDKINIKVDSFAYPFGSIESVNFEIISTISSHYKYCFSGIRGPNYNSTDKMSIRRDALYLERSYEDNQSIVNGYYSFIYNKKRKILDSFI